MQTAFLPPHSEMYRKNTQAITALEAKLKAEFPDGEIRELIDRVRQDDGTILCGPLNAVIDGLRKDHGELAVEIENLRRNIGETFLQNLRKTRAPRYSSRTKRPATAEGAEKENFFVHYVDRRKSVFRAHANALENLRRKIETLHPGEDHPLNKLLRKIFDGPPNVQTNMVQLLIKWLKRDNQKELAEELRALWETMTEETRQNIITDMKERGIWGTKTTSPV